SVCMLYNFLKLRQEYKLTLVCVHFNHGLRPEADQEEDFVKQMCRELKVKYISEKKNVKDFFQGDSLEQTARNLRYDFFLKVFRQTKIKKLALAHHKDDLVETVLMRLIRGAGLKGLRGFLPKSRYRGLTVIRPLIEMRKEDVITWLKKAKIPYHTDRSNFEDTFFRNKIRLKLLPLLQDLNPNIVESLYNIICGLSLDYDFIYAESRRLFRSLKRRQGQKAVALDIEGLKSLHPGMFNNVIRIAIEELKGDTRKIESRHLEEIRDLIFCRPRDSVVHLPTLAVKKEERFLTIQSLIL
ncbi:MAG: tRNA lysidine(34) synthetase TilS, partial [Candidatus Omnitrophota bacterium]